MKSLLAVLCLCLALPPGVAHAQERTAGELQIKAAMVRNLLLFVQWPTPPALSPLLCLFEGSTLQPSLAPPTTDATRKPAPVRIVGDNPDDWRPCHAFWVDEDRSSVLARLAVAARRQPLLLISEGNSVLERGAMISLAVEGGRMALEIDHASARAAGLGIHAKLLRLARRVKD